ncbi:MAG: hypothetical protein FWG10_01770 [Eubacteriaceae bacterium]|nr:hypothetical protein [Eubacteriaceae bacterium]
MTEEIKKLYDERVNRFITTSNLNEPDRVPIMNSTGVWAIAYSGYTYADLYENFDLETEVFLKSHEGFNYDGTRTGGGINHMVKFHNELGSFQNFISPNAVTLQHAETSSMEADEYDEFIADPFRFIANKIAVRKITAFQQDDEEEVYRLMSELFQKPAQVRAKTTVADAIKNKLGIPAISGGSNIVNPIDQIFDFVRGFKNTMTDIRRRPEKLLAAVEAMIPYAERNIPKGPLPEFPWITDNHHIAKFLTSELFGKFYWPYYKTSVEGVFNAGTKFLSHFEGSWEQHYDYLQDLPKKSLICILEDDEVEVFKNRFANQFTIYAGIHSSTLRSGDIDKCKDEAKKIIDIAAPGGGYIYGLRNGLLAPGDGDAEVIRALNKFILEYAVY